MSLLTLEHFYAAFSVFLLLAASWLIRKRTLADQRWVWSLGVVLSFCAVAAPVMGIVMALLAREHQLYTVDRILRVVMLVHNPAIILAVAVLTVTPSILVGNRWPVGRQVAFGALGLASLLLLRFVFYWHAWGSQFKGGHIGGLVVGKGLERITRYAEVILGNPIRAITSCLPTSRSESVEREAQRQKFA